MGRRQLQLTQHCVRASTMGRSRCDDEKGYKHCRKEPDEPKNVMNQRTWNRPPSRRAARCGQEAQTGHRNSRHRARTPVGQWTAQTRLAASDRRIDSAKWRDQQRTAMHGAHEEGSLGALARFEVERQVSMPLATETAGPSLLSFPDDYIGAALNHPWDGCSF